MKEYLSTYFTLLIIILLLPFLATFLLSGEHSCALYKPADMEKYLPIIVYLQIPYTHHLENIKAQTILARTNLQIQLENGTSLSALLKKPLDYLAHEQGLTCFLRRYRRFRQAAQETRGQVLTYQNQKVVLPYCYATTGSTRDGTALLHSEKYEYLVSVETPQDQKAANYLDSVYFPGTDYCEQVEILSRDEADYVLSLRVGEELLSGEEFRRMLDLPSSSFTIQELHGQTRILCRGVGHGLGFSQYGGNVLASQGKNCMEILQYYFPLLQLSSV